MVLDKFIIVFCGVLVSVFLFACASSVLSGVGLWSAVVAGGVAALWVYAGAALVLGLVAGCLLLRSKLLA